MDTTIQAVQARVAEVLGPITHPRVGAGLALSEECGEVTKLILEREVYGQQVSEEAIAAELCDVVVCVAELANLYGVDLGAALALKLDDLAKRAPGWAESLGPSLAVARARMDG
ncbi:MAG: nucleotide pyrophosphohydrolase [Planctomycetes bacterium]|nr:nucleotide pyrophosphohydrolase [Planctomycetota bacterium]